MTFIAPPPILDPPASPVEPFSEQALVWAVSQFRESASIVVGTDGRRGVRLGREGAGLPGIYPEWLGNRRFSETHGTRFCYIAGAMAHGIASVELVIAVARIGGLAIFGAGGLSLERVEAALVRLSQTLDPQGLPWGSNLLHAPSAPDYENALVDLYLHYGVRRVSASAYLRLTPAVVRYGASGLWAEPDGRIRRKHHLLAKVSRPEVARLFLSPPPEAILRQLVQGQQLSEEEAQLAARLPLATDVTAEADSGGHTDGRPLAVLLPELKQLAREIATERGIPAPRIGAAGGLGTPEAVAAAFQLGSAYVLTGSVNQACIESGLSAEGRAMLARADTSDVAMAPSADMFELAAQVQVLSRETLFASRARRLRELYRRYDSLEKLTPDERADLEQIFGQPLDAAWQETRTFWSGRDPARLTRAESNPKEHMALLFRSYLGQSSRWAIEGQLAKRADFQIWCGPAMGAFNRWVAGSFLEPSEQRTVSQVALNLLEGAAMLQRAQQLRACGLPISPNLARFAPRPLEIL